MFLSGLEASCLEEDHQKYKQHMNCLVIEDGLFSRVDCEIIFDIFESTLGIIKNCSDPGFIATCLKEIRQDWTDESSRAELLKKYEIPPRRQVIAAKLAEMNKEASGRSPSFFSAPEPKLVSSHEYAPSP
jgi:hypothetical protein